MANRVDRAQERLKEYLALMVQHDEVLQGVAELRAKRDQIAEFLAGRGPWPLP